MRRTLFLPASACAIGVAMASCTTGVTADSGADAYMQVLGGQFVRGPMPQGSSRGPAVDQATLVNDDIWANLANDPMSGTLGPTATAAAIGLQGDVGYWIVTAGAPSIATPTEPSFSATAAFSAGIVLGDYTLVVRAVDVSGNFGLPNTQTLVAEHSPTNPPPTGDLVVTLTWDTEANLDLHVVDPNGVEIDWDNQSSQPPFAFDPMEAGSYGYVDDDSNANCVIDGLRREDAIWPNPPPTGQYTVRVDTASLCGEPIAHWTVEAVLYGKTVGQASGVALDADTLGSHGAGSGVLALQFTVPE